jgi:hypothetical protein
LVGVQTVAYWNEQGCGRTELLNRAVAYLAERRWSRVIDSGWSPWDMEIYCHPWTVVQVCTAEEDHGGGRHLIRVRYRLRPSVYLKALALAAAVAVLGTPFVRSWVLAAESVVLSAACIMTWWRGAGWAAQVGAVFESLARGLGFIRCDTSYRPSPEPTAPVPAPNSDVLRFDEPHPPLFRVPVNEARVSQVRPVEDVS